MNFLTAPVLYGLAAVAIGTSIFAGVQTIRLSHAESKYDKHIAADKTAEAKAQQDARQAEHDALARQDANDKKHQKEMTDAKAEFDAAIADLRSGADRVRDRFRCPARNLPNPATPVSSRDAGEEAGFTAADAEVAFGIAKDGDDAIRQLSACQADLLSDRKLIPVNN